MLTNGIVAYLLTQPGITGILGTATTAIRPIPAPEDLDSYPLITYQAASYKGEYANQGPVGVSMTRLVFDCLAVRYLDARNMALALKTALEALSVAVSDVAPEAYLLPDGTRLFDAEIGNIADRFNDGSRISCTSVHAMLQSDE